MAAPLELTRTHRILIGVVVAGAVLIAGIGFAGSYAAVRDLAEKKGFGDFSLVFPIGIDAGICVLLALDLLLTWIRIPFPLLRQTAWLLTAATIAFNGAAAWPDPLGVGMHAVIPVLFVVAVEAARHAIGRIADITADKHMEGVRLTRWLLSPLPTFLLWRRMKLWELRSYEQVIKLEQERLVYQARLRSRYGRAWRRKAPVESLMPLRLAKYGVPLAETAPTGLAAAGIDAPLLPSAPAARELTPATGKLTPPRQESATPERHEDHPEDVDHQPDEATPAHRPQPQHPDANPWFAAPPRPAQYDDAYEPQYDPGYDPTYVPEEQYEQWYEAQHGPTAEGIPAGPHHLRNSQQPAPQPDLTKQPAARTAENWSPEQADEQPGEPQPAPAAAELPHDDLPHDDLPDDENTWRVPSGPNRTRRLGGAAAEAGRPEVHLGSPQLESAEPEAEPTGPALPEDVPREEVYFQAFRKYVNEYLDFPNARQFGLYLQDLYGLAGQSGAPLAESTLRPYLREFRTRYQRELDSDAEYFA